MNDYKELISELRKCKYCARNTAKYAADALEQIVAEYNELDKAHLILKLKRRTTDATSLR